MIKNERQYQLASEQVAKLRRAVEEMQTRPRPAGENPKRKKRELSAVQGQITELSGELEEYSKLRAGTTQVEPVRDLASLPRALIRQRIARGFTQKQLAEMLGVREQQVQRDEANDYASAGLDRLQRVADTLRVSVDMPTQDTSSVPSIDQLLRILDAAGVDKKFLQRKLVSRVVRTKNKEAAMPTLDLIGRLGRVFSWPASVILAGQVPAMPHMAASYKEPANASSAKSIVYTAYAHFCARLLLAASDTVAKIFPKAPLELREFLVSRYGGVGFQQILNFAWDHGIAVFPLNEKGGFHAAVFRFSDGRSTVVLKQAARYRWEFDLLHEIAHLIFKPAGELAIVDADGTRTDGDDEERAASAFAASVIFKGRGDELTSSVIRKSGSDVRYFKIAIAEVAAKAKVSPGALAQHTAFLLAQSGQSVFWGHAHNIAAAEEQDPYRLALDAVYKNVQWNRLGEIDRDILSQALSA